MKLTKHIEQKEIEFADDSKITCKLEYTAKDYNEHINTTMLVKVAPHYNYEYDKETGKINRVPILEATSYKNMMQLERGYPDTMQHFVHELSWNYINANGLQDTTDKFYFSGSSLNFETPFVNQTNVDETIFTAFIDFKFDT